MQNAVIHTNAVTQFSVYTLDNLCAVVGLVGLHVPVISMSALSDQLHVFNSGAGKLTLLKFAFIRVCPALYQYCQRPSTELLH